MKTKECPRPIVVADLFAGAGGSACGAVQAVRDIGREVHLTALNHWPRAVETHRLNHPKADHYCVDIDAAKPEELVPGGYLDLLMASPECIFFSTARGGKPINDQKRASAWHILRWCERLYVKRLLIENVPEFVWWGPLDRRNRPLKSRRGETFRGFVGALQAMGYKVEWRILNAADYGEATTRKRLFMQARRDGKAIVWPQASHSGRRAEQEAFGLTAWRGAREVINFSKPSQSIFTRSKALSANTLARIAAGASRLWGELAPAYLVVLRRHAAARSLDLPIPAITAKGNHFALVQTSVTPFVLGQQSGAIARDAANPLPTVAASGAVGLVEPFVIEVNHKGHRRARTTAEPLPTLTSKRNLAMIEPFVLGNQNNAAARSARAPMVTITSNGGRSMRLIEPVARPFSIGNRAHNVAKALEEPIPTVTTANGGGVALVEPVLGRVTGNVDADRVVLIDGVPHQLDIHYRMLQPDELALAMGFPGEYEFTGTKTEKTMQIGNAVSVKTARALVRATLWDMRAVSDAGARRSRAA